MLKHAPVHQSTRTASIGAGLDMRERFPVAPTPAYRRPTVRKHEPRLTDDVEHPVTVTRIYEPWHEVALTDECEFGCKVLERTVGRKTERVTVHSRVYGCTHDDAH